MTTRCSHGTPLEFRCQGCWDDAMGRVGLPVTRAPVVPPQILERVKTYPVEACKIPVKDTK